MIELVLGGARSGKSSFAEQRAANFEHVIYIATAEALDGEMQARINHHQQTRPSHWQLIEEPLKLSETLEQYSRADNCLLVDCLTLWLSNQLYQHEDQWLDTQQQLILTLQNLPGEVILVSNEVGQGVVPENKLARKFIDHAGRLHQQIASIADSVTFVTAGIAQPLKSPGKS